MVKSARLSIECSACRHHNNATASYCSACGAPLAHARPDRGDRAQRAVISGELKQATILFADIVSSTDLVATLDPEQAMGRLRPAVTTMCEAVSRFEGTVLRTMGDGILALFGAPRTQEGHALLACRAALAMQEQFPLTEGGLSIRIGLHSGEVVFDAGDDRKSIQDSAHGLAIHLASRLQALADPGGICLTEQCNRLIRSTCETTPLGVHVLKGIPEPVGIYSLSRLKPAASSRPLHTAGPALFRGRAREFAMLQDALSRTEDGDTQVVGIVGEPGTGKSRLCFEFALWCRARQVAVYEARAQPYGHATPFQSIIDLLRLLFHLAPAEEEAVARRRVAEQLAGIGPTFDADVSLLCQFLGLSAGESGPSRLGPNARQVRLLDIIRFMVGRTGARGSVVILEDLHWADEASEDFVSRLAAAVAGTSVMLVLNHRSSYLPPWASAPRYVQIPLGDLAHEDAIALIEDLVGPRTDLDELRLRIAERSNGNPFFVEELVRSLAETGALAGEPGDYAPGVTTNEGTLPVTVQDVVGSRIDGLGDADKSLLHIGAIIGKEISLTLLEAVAGLSPDEIGPILARLREAGMIQPDGARSYAFRHPLIQEVAYRSQLKARRRTLHALLARTMESTHREQLDEFAGLIAYHHEAAEQPLAAAQFAARAATWVGSTNTGQAIKGWQKVRLLLQSQPRSPGTDSLRIMASAQIAWLGWREGLTAEEARPFIEEALGWAREIDDTMVPLLLFVEARLVGASGGSAELYVSLVKQALALLEGGRSSGRAAILNASLSQAFSWAGLFRDALDANDAALSGLPGIEEFDHRFLGYNVEHWIVSLRGRILVELGRFDDAQRCFDLMTSIDPSLIDPTVLFISHFDTVNIGWCKRDVALAEHHAVAVGAIADRHGSRYLRVFAFAATGTAKATGRDFEAAVRDFVAALAFMRQSKAALDHEAEMLSCLAECYLGAGDSGAALETAEEAIALAKRLDKRVPELRASIVRGAALLSVFGPARRAEAEAAFRRAEELVLSSGAVIYETALADARAGSLPDGDGRTRSENSSMP